MRQYCVPKTFIFDTARFINESQRFRGLNCGKSHPTFYYAETLLLSGFATGTLAPLQLFALMWSRADVIGLFSNNVVSFSRNVVLREPLILNQCGLKTSDVIGSRRLCSQFATGRDDAD